MLWRWWNPAAGQAVGMRKASVAALSWGMVFVWSSANQTSKASRAFELQTELFRFRLVYYELQTEPIADTRPGPFNSSTRSIQLFVRPSPFSSFTKSIPALRPTLKLSSYRLVTLFEVKKRENWLVNMLVLFTS
jgi:hypothetical protein